MNPSIRTNEFRSVRWPLRLLAALIVVVGGVAVLASAWAAFSGRELPGHGAGAGLLASLPGAAWLLNIAWSAAVRGRAPENAHWPFASDRVMTAYMVAMYLLVWR